MRPRFNRGYLRRNATCLSLIVVAGLIVSSCGPDMPSRGDIVRQGNQSYERNVLPSTNEMVVYLDTSSPMKGYVFKDGRSVFSRTLQVLRQVATTVRPVVEVRLRTVDSVLSAPMSNIEIANAASDQSVYKGSETNIVQAIKSFPVGLTLPPGAVPPDEQAPKPPRFHVLVTDGVQYSRQAQTALSCASGSDAFCVQKEIMALLNRGWAGAILGLRSEFCCSFFSEKRQIRVPYDTSKVAPKDYRPFYLYIFSPDQRGLEELVVRIKEGLRRAVPEGELVLRQLALTQQYADPVSEFGEGDFQSGDRRRLRGRRADRELPLLVTLNLAAESKAIQVPFKLQIKINWTQHALDGASVNELASLLKWDVLPVYPQKPIPGIRYPEVTLQPGKVEIDDRQRLILPLNAAWPLAAGSTGWRAFRLQGRLNVEGESPSWIRDWSTEMDSTSDTGNRTLDLLTSLLGIWNNPVLKEQAIVELYLRVGPQ